MYHLDLKIDYLPPMNTAATRRHHMAVAKHTRKVRQLVVALVGRNKPEKPLTRARILCERHSGSRRPESENLQMSFKPFIDALTKSEWKKRNKRDRRPPYYIQRADVLEDDGPEFLEREYEWHPAPPRKGFLRIVVEELAS